MSALLLIPWFRIGALTIPGTDIEIQPFGVLVAIGVLSGARLAEWRGARVGVRRSIVADLAMHAVAIGFVLGHVFDMAFYHPEKVAERPWELLMFWTSLSSYGGFFGAVVGGFYWRHRRQLPLLPVLDQIAFGLPLGWFFGRLGCFVVHDHPGKISHFFLAVADFQYAALPEGPRHDLGLYEVIWSALVMVFFLALDRRRWPRGFFVGAIAVLYAPLRFGLDFLREVDRTYWGLTAAQFSSVVALLLGIWCLRLAYRSSPALPPSLAVEPAAA